METNKLIKIIENKDKKELEQFLEQPISTITEAVTGIFSSNQMDWILSAGKLLQAAVKGSLLKQLGRELKKYREDGKIKEDYFASNKSQASLFEFLKFIDEKVPEEELFRAMKSIFFTGITDDCSELDQILAYEFIKVAQKLSGTEILILKANHEINIGQVSEDLDKMFVNSAQSKRKAWRALIAWKVFGDKSFDSIIFSYEGNLESLGLISNRSEDSRFSDEFTVTHHFRLTEMGLKFCEFITKYK